MRVIPVKLTNKNLRLALADLRHALRIPDRGFVEDLFCLVRRKGLGIPDAKALQKVCDMQAKSEGLSRHVLLMFGKVRVASLTKIVASTLFKQTYLSPNPLEALRLYLHASVGTGINTQKARCAMCKLNPTCKFYAKYAKIDVVSLHAVSKKDVRDLVPGACPDRPSVDVEELVKSSADPVKLILGAGTSAGLASPFNLNLLEESAKDLDAVYNPFNLTEDEEKLIAKYDQLAQKDSGLVDKSTVEDFNASDESATLTGGGKAIQYYDVDHSGLTPITFSVSTIEAVAKSAIPFLTLAQKLEQLVSGLSSTKFKPSMEITPNFKEKQIKQVSEAVNASMFTHALPDDIFNAKVAKKQITVTKYEKVDERQKAFYVVADFSMSMRYAMGTVGGIEFSRSAVTSAFALAMLTRVLNEGGVFIMRGFAAVPDPHLIYVNAKEPDAELRASAARQYILSCMYDGGGTSVPAAIHQAAYDIAAAKGVNNLLHEAEIMLITDADDRALTKPETIAALRSAIGSTVLNVIDVCPLESYSQNMIPTAKLYKQGLESLSDTYFLAKSNALNLEGLVDQVGGKKRVSDN